MGERLLCKQEVIGSIPFTSTTSGARAPLSGDNCLEGSEVQGVDVVRSVTWFCDIVERKHKS